MAVKSAAFWRRSSGTLYCLLLSLASNTQPVWITALLTCSLAPCKIFSTVSDNLLVSFAFVADYYHLTVHIGTKQHFQLYRQTAGHNTLLAMQRLIKRNTCMLGLVVFEIQVAPLQRGKASSILLHSTDKVKKAGFWAASKTDSQGVYKPSNSL